MNNNVILKVESVTVQRSGNLLLEDISFELGDGDHLTITGPSGSGKTTLGLALANSIYFTGRIQWATDTGNIVWVEQQHHFKNLHNTSDLYYQQRFNSIDSEDTQTVDQSLPGDQKEIDRVLKKMHIEYLREKPLIQLSNGENKKIQLAAALLSNPSVLIMDQPFIGLDVTTRKYVHDFINELADQRILIILITSPDEIPSCITQIASLEHGKLKTFREKQAFLQDQDARAKPARTAIQNGKTLPDNLAYTDSGDFEYAIRMKNVSVRYGNTEILQNIHWTVKKGERWLLSGPNGAGKSTLLSLVTGDNPQAYANEIDLFDKRRGSGETIWDIKQKIGFLSPELHVFFDQHCTVFDAVASGLFDTVGLFRRLSETATETVNTWLNITGIASLGDRRLPELSLGEQRIALLARALVKNPPLLILDEPCQGIDDEKQDEIIQLINNICIHGNKTMVFVTHYTNKKPECIGHFLHLEKGMVVDQP